MKNILVTGGAGFIGSNFIKYMLKKYSDCKIINVDLLTYAGNLVNLKDIEGNSNHIFIKGDIRDRQKLADIFSTYDIDVLINFAAESHVDRSIIDSETFLTTNIIGTQVLLDTAKYNWKLNPDDEYYHIYKPGAKFIQISTDEVYGSLGENGRFTEDTPLNPKNPYSASKAGADLLIKSYHETFGLPVIITRCSNNYGPFQFPEKLIPVIILNALAGKPLPIYGDGSNMRDWLFVEDHADALLLVLENGQLGRSYNIGGENERSNLELVHTLCTILDQKHPKACGSYANQITFVTDRPGHDTRYAIDPTRICSELGWRPSVTVEEGLARTVDWYLANEAWWRPLQSRQGVGQRLGAVG